MSWFPSTGGGGPVTIANGADVVLGNTSDAAGAATIMGQVEQINLNGASSATATITSTAISTSSFTIHNATTGRKGITIYNDSANVLYVAFANAATTSAYTFQLPSQTLYECPAPALYTGKITGISLTAAGNVRVTELT